jgi:hypothetical protein
MVSCHKRFFLKPFRKTVSDFSTVRQKYLIFRPERGRGYGGRIAKVISKNQKRIGFSSPKWDQIPKVKIGHRVDIH